ncbi:MAG TPA: RraA family protein [Bryobacteraceae bacterium]|nr:RraA family protein [Bryobacteraceae bacterium]
MKSLAYDRVRLTTHPTIRQVPSGILEQLRALDSCTVSNAIERLDVRLFNEGFTDISIRCMSPGLPPMVGYAATGRIRTSVAPAMRHWYYERMDFWEYLLTIPEPRVIVLQDVDGHPGFGALFGEIHANIGRALGCIGYVTNGSLRDLPGIERTGFHLFGRGVSVSHSYAHVVDYGEPVYVGGLKVNPGDLLHGDRHGVVSVPNQVAGEIPQIAAELLAKEGELIQLCQSEDFTMEKLARQIERTRHVSK